MLPEPASAIAGRRGMEESEAEDLLESMAVKRLIHRIRVDEDV
jgi:hypothetical protein